MPSSASLVRLLRRRFGIVIAAMAVAQSIAIVVLRPGCFSIDEVTYQAMTRAVAKAGSLAVDNGWNLAHSPELEWRLVRNVDGRLVSQYPHGFPVIAAPLYALLGVSALFVLNTLSFYGTVLLCRSLAREVLRKEGAALLASLVFACATFAWEYSIGAWPHAATTLLTTAAFHEALRAARAPSRKHATLGRIGAGALMGLAITFRLDAAFMLPVLLVLPALVPSRERSPDGRAPPPSSFQDALTILIGTAPGWVFLTLTNYAKFGSRMPLSYGPWHADSSNTSAAPYAPLAALALCAFVAAHVLAPRLERLRARHVLTATAIAAAALLVPSVREAATRTIDGLWMLVLDLRHRDLAWEEAGLARSDRGAMIYVGALKKALLQSSPYLPLAVFSLLGRSNDAELRRRKLAVALPVVIYVAVLSYFRWHGGLSLNLRYFSPTLPFIAILVADGMVRIGRRCAGVVRVAQLGDLVVLAWAALYVLLLVVLQMPRADWGVRECFYLDAPLVLAGALSVALVVASVPRVGTLRHRAAAAAFLLGAGAVVWGALTELTYDSVAVLRVRAHARIVAERARAFVPGGSLVVADYPDPVAGLLEDGDLLADGSRDRLEDAPRLVSSMACAGRRSFAVMRRGPWERFRPLAVEGGLHVDVLRDDRTEGFVIARLTPTDRVCHGSLERSHDSARAYPPLPPSPAEADEGRSPPSNVR